MTRAEKKRLTREALQAAALRLALERGPDNVRVDDIAEAAGVSPRTYNNYFASREQAIVAGLTAGRAARLATGGSLADAVAALYTDAYLPPALATSPALLACYLDAAATIEEPLTEALAARHPGIDPLTAEVLAAAVSAAVRVALRRWLRPAGEAPPSMPGLVVPAGSLPDLIRAALRPLAPALDLDE